MARPGTGVLQPDHTALPAGGHVADGDHSVPSRRATAVVMTGAELLARGLPGAVVGKAESQSGGGGEEYDSAHDVAGAHPQVGGDRADEVQDETGGGEGAQPGALHERVSPGSSLTARHTGFGGLCPVTRCKHGAGDHVVTEAYESRSEPVPASASSPIPCALEQPTSADVPAPLVAVVDLRRFLNHVPIRGTAEAAFSPSCAAVRGECGRAGQRPVADGHR